MAEILGKLRVKMRKNFYSLAPRHYGKLIKELNFCPSSNFFFAYFKNFYKIRLKVA